MWLKKNAIPKTRMHTTHSNILEPILDFSLTSLQVMTDDLKRKQHGKCINFDNSSEFIVSISIVDYSNKYVLQYLQLKCI